MKFLGLMLTAATEATQGTGAAQGETNALMGMVDTMDLLILLMLLGFGVYVLYTAFRLNREQMLFANKILYPGDCKPEDCADEGGFIDYILPRMVILGIAMLVQGIVLGLNIFLFKINAMWFDILMMVVPVTVFTWYIVAQRKAAKLFW